MSTTSLAAPRIIQSLDISPVWSGHPVGFCLLTRPPNQYIAYYDAQRRMTIASRSLDSTTWTYQILPQQLGWDSHNYITMAFDRTGQLHLSGNMHAVPMVYFRTTKPGDITTLTRLDKFVGSDEAKCTYPSFLTGPNNEFIFTYRSGYSGNGNQIYNLYDPDTQTFSRLLDQPLTDGQGHMNAYFQGPIRGPDGYFHLCWVWRDHGGCETNHDLSYARSRDLRHWENAQGKPLTLPITLTPDCLVDPVPIKQGMINGNTKIGFDSHKRAIITYHKFDAAGNTQLYNARLENGAWKIYQTTNWTYCWYFSGGGSIPFEIRVGAITPKSNNTLTLSYDHIKEGSGLFQLDESTLRPIAKLPPPILHPPELDKVESTFPGMQVRWTSDSGRSSEKGITYFLRSETLPTNRDRPRQGDIPSPSPLRLYKIQQ